MKRRQSELNKMALAILRLKNGAVLTVREAEGAMARLAEIAAAHGYSICLDVNGRLDKVTPPKPEFYTSHKKSTLLGRGERTP